MGWPILSKAVIDQVAQRLAEASDPSRRGVRGNARREFYPLAAIFLGSLVGSASSDAPLMPDDALDIAVALELVDAAAVAHYHDTDRQADERLIVGDYWYAGAMVMVAGTGRPDLVRRFAEATSDVALGHAVNLDGGDVDATLALRSALFPVAVELAAVFSGVSVPRPAVELARRVGIAREAVLARLPDAGNRGRKCESELTDSDAATGRPLGAQTAYVANFIRQLGHYQRPLDDSK